MSVLDYIRTTWQDAIDSKPSSYLVDSIEKIITKVTSGISTPGTNMNAARMNNIETGLEYVINAENSDISVITNPQSVPGTQLYSPSNVEATFESLVNLADNGVDYVNHIIAGAGTTKGADGIHLVADGANDLDRLLITFKESTEYTIFYKVKESTLDDLMYISDNLTGSFESIPKTLGINKFKLTTQATITTNRLQFVTASGNTDTTYIDYEILAVLEGDRTDLDLTEELDFGINDYKQRIISNGKNQFDKNKSTNDKFANVTDGSLSVDDRFYVSEPIKCIGGSSYTLSDETLSGTAGTTFYDGAGNFISGTTDRVFSAPVDAVTYRSSFRKTTQDIDTAQIEKGLLETAFEAYKESYVDLDGASVPNIGDTNKLKNVSDNINVNGNESYTQFLSGQGINNDLARMYIQDFPSDNGWITDNTTDGEGLGLDTAGIFYRQDEGSGFFGTEHGFTLILDRLYILIPESELNTVDGIGFIDYIKANNISFKVRLATPIPRVNSETLSIYTNGQVYTDGHLPLSLDLKDVGDNSAGVEKTLVETQGNQGNRITELEKNVTGEYQEFNPTLTWTTAVPNNLKLDAKYKIIGTMCNVIGKISSDDGNGATALTIELPFTHGGTAFEVPITSQQKVDTTYSNPLAQTDITNEEIKFNNFSTATSAVDLEILFNFSYEIEVM